MLFSIGINFIRYQFVVKYIYEQKMYLKLWNKTTIIDRKRQIKGKEKTGNSPAYNKSLFNLSPPPPRQKPPLTCTKVNDAMHPCTLLSPISQVIWIWPTNLVIQMKTTNFFSPAIWKETVDIGTNEKFKILTHNVVVEGNTIQYCTKIGSHVWK